MAGKVVNHRTHPELFPRSSQVDESFAPGTWLFVLEVVRPPAAPAPSPNRGTRAPRPRPRTRAGWHGVTGSRTSCLAGMPSDRECIPKPNSCVGIHAGDHAEGMGMGMGMERGNEKPCLFPHSRVGFASKVWPKQICAVPRGRDATHLCALPVVICDCIPHGLG